jgi:hypothetical protein
MARTARRSEKAKKPVRPLADERVLAVIAQIEERRARLKMSIPTMCDKAGDLSGDLAFVEGRGRSDEP